ncbi:MAG: hypothetical protein GY870_17010 [archaeon]|nr:hypothetical protein [archaeon]
MKLDGQKKKFLSVLAINLIIFLIYFIITFFWYDKTIFNMFVLINPIDNIILGQWIALIVVNLYASLIILPIALNAAEFNSRFTILVYLYEVSSQIVVIGIIYFMITYPFNILLYILFLIIPILNSVWITIYTFNETAHTL